MSLRIGASAGAPLGCLPVLLQRFQVTLESPRSLPLAKCNANEQTTEEKMKEIQAMSLSEPSETSTDFAQPVNAELSTHFFIES